MARAFRFGPFRLDASQRVLLHDETLVTLPPKVVDTLLILVERAGEVVDKDTLFRAVWPDTHVVESSLTRNISVLRRAIDAESGKSMIETVAKRGYRFVVPVTIEESPAIRTADAKSAGLRQAVAVAVVAIAAGVGNQPWTPRVRPSPPTAADREYLVGLHHWNKLERARVVKALDHFQRAAELDPQSALAQAGIADAYVQLSNFGLASLANGLTKAREAAIRAVALNPRLAQPHVSLGMVRLFADFAWRDAETEFRQGTVVDPRSAAAYYGLATWLTYAGRLAEARMAMQRARDLDPAWALIASGAGRIEYYDHRFERAVEVLREALEIEPSFPQAHYYLGMSFGFLHRIEEARKHLLAANVHSSLAATEDAWLQASGGDPGAARALITERSGGVERGELKPTVLVLPAIDAGDHDLALRSLEGMWKTREPELVQIKVNPRLDPLRGDSRFVALVRHIAPD